MDTITLIGVISLVVLGATSGFLALWCDYNDGVFGHTSLALMTLCALVVVMESLGGAGYQFLPTTTMTFAAMACFMLRHAFRAWRFRK
jgi:hypothetical protein